MEDSFLGKIAEVLHIVVMTFWISSVPAILVGGVLLLLGSDLFLRIAIVVWVFAFLFHGRLIPQLVWLSFFRDHDEKDAAE